MRFAHQRIRLSVVFRIALILSLVAVLASIGVTVSARPRWNGPPPPSTYHYIDVTNPITSGTWDAADLSTRCNDIYTVTTTVGEWYAFGSTGGTWRHDTPYGPHMGIAYSLTGSATWYLAWPSDMHSTHEDRLLGTAYWDASDWISAPAWVPSQSGITWDHPAIIFQATQDTLYFRLPDVDCPDNDDGGEPWAYNDKFLDWALMNVYFDTFPPETTPVLGGVVGLNGYYTSPVTVMLTAIDPESLPTQPAAGVGSTTLDGAAYGGPILVSNQGTTTHSYYSVDLAGNTETAHSLDVTIDSVPPTSTITAPAHGSVITGTVTITGTASDATAGLDMVLVSTDGGATWPIAVGTDPWALDWDTTAVADGPYAIMASAADLAGNLEIPPASVGVSTDNLPPTTVITTAPAGWVNGTITIAGMASDTVSSVASVAYSSDGGMNWYAATGTDNWTFNWDTTTAPDGPVTMQARSTDAMSHVEAPPVEAIIQVDNAPPTLAVTAAPSGWVTGIVTITGTLTDPHSGPAQVEYSLDDGATWQTATGAAAWTFDVDTDPLPRGNTTILVRGLDALGNTSGPVFVTFNVGTPPPSDEAQPGDTRLPHLEASWPAEWDITCGPASVDFNITASDDGSGIKGIAVIISGNGIADRVLKGPAQNWSGALTWDGLDGAGNRVQPGVYHVWVGAWDHAGNYATREGSIRVTDCAIAAPVLAPTVIPPPPSTTTTTQTTGAPPAPAQGAPLPAATQPPDEVAELTTGAVPQPAVIAPPPAVSPRTIDGETPGAAGTAAGIGVTALLGLAGAYVAAKRASQLTTMQSAAVTPVWAPAAQTSAFPEWLDAGGLLLVRDRATQLLGANSGRLNEKDPTALDIHIIDDMNKVSNYPWQWGGWDGTTSYYVCADVVRDIYETLGIDIENILSDYGDPGYCSRNAVCYYLYSRDNDPKYDTLKEGSEFPYLVGEWVVLYDATVTGTAPNGIDYLANYGYHMGIVVESGGTIDEVMILQASYTEWEIQEITLREYVRRAYTTQVYLDLLPAYQDRLRDGTITNEELLAKAAFQASVDLEEDPEGVLDRIVFHGHPVADHVPGGTFPYSPSSANTLSAGNSFSIFVGKGPRLSLGGASPRSVGEGFMRSLGLTSPRSGGEGSVRLSGGEEAEELPGEPSPRSGGEGAMRLSGGEEAEELPSEPSTRSGGEGAMRLSGGEEAEELPGEPSPRSGGEGAMRLSGGEEAAELPGEPSPRSDGEGAVRLSGEPSTQSGGEESGQSSGEPSTQSGGKAPSQSSGGSSTRSSGKGSSRSSGGSSKRSGGKAPSQSSGGSSERSGGEGSGQSSGGKDPSQPSTRSGGSSERSGGEGSGQSSGKSTRSLDRL